MPSTPSNSLSKQHLLQLEQFIKINGQPIFRGIEKEGLRATPDYTIAQTNHPQALGHPLTHPSITTDYSEALLELITPVAATREALVSQLEAIHHFTLSHLDDELLWPGSMPCRLNGEASIRIAEYGHSNQGKLKYVYRHGLGVRYGRIMQSIAGLHYNFSLNDTFWLSQQTYTDSELSLADFKSKQYFALIRNFRRYSWLLMYLFGASPVLDGSFLNGKKNHLNSFDQKNSYYKPYATSLRMGDLGYHNNAQSALTICFNSLTNFTKTLEHAIHTSYPPYAQLGLKNGDQFIQLNTNILQIENEYYSSIRPKRTIKSGEKPNQALMARGVEYIEVRCLDLNPFLAIGIAPQQIDFLDVFLLYCLLLESPYIGDPECESLDENFNLTVNEGRNPKTLLAKAERAISIKEWGRELLNDMQPIAEILDLKRGDGRYQFALSEQLNKLLDPELTPSAQVLSVMQQESLSWLEFAGELARKHKATLASRLTEKLGSTAVHQIDTEFAQAAIQSFNAAKHLEASDQMPFAQFLAAYQNE